MPAKLTHLARAFFAQQGLPYDEALAGEARRILANFIGSEAYREIKGSEILGREVPFFYTATDVVRNTNIEQSRAGSGSLNHAPPTPLAPPTAPPLVRGTMDILYRLPSGQLIIGDYKTSRLPLASEKVDSPIGRVAGWPKDKYAVQSAAYREAVRLTLREDAVFKIIPLHS